MPGQGQGHRDEPEDGDHDERVVGEGEARDQPDRPVVDDHEDHDHRDAEDAGEEALGQELRPEGRTDPLGRQLQDRERQRAELQDGDQVVRLGRREAADPAGRDLDLAVRDGALDLRRGDHGRVEGDREELADVVGGEVGEALRAVVLEHEVDGEAAALVLADRRGRDLVAAEQRGRLGEVDDLALGRARGPERDEVEAAGLADELAHGVGVGDARQLDDDAVVALGHHDGLGDAGRVHPALDDVLDDRHVGGGRRLALDLLRLVLDAQAAGQVEAQLRLDGTTAGRGGAVRKREVREEVDDEGEDADEDDEDGATFSHVRGMVHGTSRRTPMPGPTPRGSP